MSLARQISRTVSPSLPFTCLPFTVRVISFLSLIALLLPSYFEVASQAAGCLLPGLCRSESQHDLLEGSFALLCVQLGWVHPRPFLDLLFSRGNAGDFYRLITISLYKWGERFALKVSLYRCGSPLSGSPSPDFG